MNSWLPSLNALRAFEATCRHLSFAHAAAELRVTPAAVQQLVRKLEETLGLELVVRSGRGIAITAAGRAGLEDLTSGFAQIKGSVGKVLAWSGGRRLIVSVEPSFATAWLVPRLERFRTLYPDFDVLIDSSLHLVDLQNGAADVAIRFGATPDRALISHRLFDEQLSAFCSPSLARGKHRLRQLADLERATLIHWDLSALGWANATRGWMGWQPWLEKLGARQIDWRRGIRFNDYNLAVQAAIAGQGVVLGSLPVLKDLLDGELLVCPFPDRVDTDIGYDMVTSMHAFERPEVRSFADWIIAEAAAGR